MEKSTPLYKEMYGEVPTHVEETKGPQFQDTEVIVMTMYHDTKVV